VSNAELCRVTRRAAAVVAKLRSLLKHGDTMDNLEPEILELERDVDLLIDDVQLRELTKFRRRTRKEPRSTDLRVGTIHVEHLELQGARQ
jgi:hypothetical protein